MPSATPTRSACVLVTGATGFLGKVVLEELLRQRDRLGVGKVVVLARGKRGMSPQERFEKQVAPSACFSRLPEDWLESVEVVAGDLSEARCGLDEPTYKALTGRVTHIIHCAASVEFDLPVRDAAVANIDATLNVLDLARASRKLRRFISTSTAYVTPHRKGPILEELAPLPRPASEIYDDIKSGRVSEKELLASTGHPNTYTFTKCVVEHLLHERRGKVPVTIVRPSIISASWRHPFTGWIDSSAAFAGFVATIGGGFLKVIDADRDAVLDVVPVDVVSDRLIEHAFTPRKEDGTTPIAYATVGLDHGALAGATSQSIVEFFRRYPAQQRSHLAYMGPRNLIYQVHDMLHHQVPARAAQAWFGARGDAKMRRKAQRMAQTIQKINNVFPYFTHNTFDFRASTPVDATFDIQSYVQTVCRGVYTHLLKYDPTQVKIGGEKHKSRQADVLWCLGRPFGNVVIRVSAMTLRKVMRQVFDEVTFDQQSFDRAVEAAGPGGNLVIVPTHRSYMDFLVCSYLFFARPDLGIDIPYVAAAQEFAEIPVVGWLFKQMQAFYLKRGTGKEDVELTSRVHDLINEGKTLEFFIEGQRSRSRQFLQPRRGLLRALQSSGKRFVVLPVSISYDRVPEEQSLLRELRGYAKEKMLLRALLQWTARMAKGEVKLGRMHIRCGEPLLLDQHTDVVDLSQMVMAQLQGNTVATTYHLRCFAHMHGQAGVDVTWLREAIERRGGIVLDSPMSPKAHVVLDPLLERCLRHHWVHLFFSEALAAQPNNPALQHYVAENGYAQARVDTPAVLADMRVQRLLFHLFAPVCADYVAVARTVKRSIGKGGTVTAEQILRNTAYKDFVTAQAAVRALVSRGYLSPVAGGQDQYTVQARSAELSGYIERCGWLTPKALEAGAWSRAVGT